MSSINGWRRRSIAHALHCSRGILRTDDPRGQHGPVLKASVAALRVRCVDGSGGLKFQGVDWYWFTSSVTRAVRAAWRPCGRTGEPILRRRRSQDARPHPHRPPRPPRLGVPQAPPDGAAAPFSALSSHLATVPLAAPCYAVAAGPSGEGVVFSRNETASVPVRLGGAPDANIPRPDQL